MTFLVRIVFGLCIMQIHAVLYGMAYDAQRLHDLSLTRNVGASCWVGWVESDQQPGGKWV